MVSCAGAGLHGIDTGWSALIVRSDSGFRLPVPPQQLAHRGPGHQRQFAGLRNYRSPAEHGEVLALDGVQNFLAAAGEEFQIYR